MAKDPSDILKQYGLDENLPAEENMENFVDPNEEEPEEESYPIDSFDPKAFMEEHPVEDVKSFDPKAFMAENPVDGEKMVDSTQLMEDIAKQNRESLGALGKQAARSATFGLADKLGAYIGSKLDPNKEVDESLQKAGFTIQQPENTYSSNLAKLQKAEAEEKEAHPGAHLAGELAGYLVPGVGIEKAVGKGLGKIAPRLAELANMSVKGAREAGVGGQALAARSLKGGLDVGAFSAGSSAASDIAPGGENLVNPDIVTNALNAGQMGFVGGAALSPIAELGRKVFGKGSLRKGLAKVGGPDIVSQEAFKNTPEALQNTLPLEKLMDDVNAEVAKIKAAADAGKMTAEEANAALKQARDFANKEFAQHEKNLNNALKDASDAIKNTPPPEEAVTRVHDAIDALQTKAIEESQQVGKELLNPAKQVVTKAEFLAGIDNRIAELSKAKSKIEREAAKALKEHRKMYVETLPDVVSEPEAKDIILGLDKDTKWNNNLGVFDEAVNSELKSIRTKLDQRLKTGNTPYAEAQQSVAEKFRLLEQVSGRLGTVSKAKSIFTSNKPMNFDVRNMIQDLQNASGADIMSELQPFLEKANLRNSRQGLESLKKSLPEYKKTLEFATEQAPIMAPPGEFTPMALKPQAKAAQAADTEAGRLQAIFDQYKSLSPASTEATVKGLLEKPSITDTRMLENLSKESGKDLAGNIERRRMAEAMGTAETPNYPAASEGDLVHPSTPSIMKKIGQSTITPLTKGLIGLEKGMESKASALNKLIEKLPKEAADQLRKVASKIKPAAETGVKAGVLKAAAVQSPNSSPQGGTETLKPEQQSVPMLAKEARGHLDNITESDIDRMKMDVPNEDKPEYNALRNILENARTRDTKGRAALLFSLKQNPAYRPFIEKHLRDRGTANER